MGLAAAVELGRRGIDCIVIEPRTTVSHMRPRCKTVNVRTLEHLRRWGIAEQLRERAPLPTSYSDQVVFCTSLRGRELSRFSGVFGLAPQGDRFPELGQQAPQYVLEELLRDTVAEIPSCTLITGSRVTSVEQTADAATTTVADADGREVRITSEYVIGCDGPRSTVRDAIGSGYVGEHALRPNFGMVFAAPQLVDQVRHGPAVHYWVVNSVTPALMGPLDLNGSWWMIAFGVERDDGELRAKALIDGAVGEPIEATVLSTDPWTARMQLVDRARVGRVFLAGDAAHLNPPFGGHGLNTGFGDAVDLGWKLAAVLDGWGGAGLLSSYEAERRPVQMRVIDAATENMKVLATELLVDDLEVDGPAGDQARRRAHEQIQRTKRAEFHALDLVLDIAYESPIVAEGGARLAHSWLGPGRSIYDVLGEGMTLLVVDTGVEESVAAVVATADARGVPLDVAEVAAAGLRDRYGAALVLVRPDQHVAWQGDRWPDDGEALWDQNQGCVKRQGGSRMKRLIVVCAAMCALVAPTCAAAEPAPPVADLGVASSPSGASCQAYSFKILQNAGDATRQSVWGELCHRAPLTGKTPVQVLIHGGAYNHTYWDNPYHPATYSYVKWATDRGYATLNIDRLGYGQSDHPDPTTLNFDVAGFVTHQLVMALRQGALGPQFSTVILNGHSMGAMAAENEAANYKDIDGIILTGIGHNLFGNKPPPASFDFSPAATDPRYVGQPEVAGYLTTRPGSRTDAFITPGTIEPGMVSVEENTLKDTMSANELTSMQQQTNDGGITMRIRAPVLFAQGRFDSLWCSRSGDCTTDPQAAMESSYYAPGVSFTRIVIDKAGHSVNSCVTAPEFYADTFSWLNRVHLAPAPKATHHRVNHHKRKHHRRKHHRRTHRKTTS